MLCSEAFSIKTERLTLLVPTDLTYSKDLLEVWTDYDVVQPTLLDEMSTIEEANKRLESIISRVDPDFNNNFLILLDNKAIGCIGLPIVNKENCEYSIYYHIGKEYWSKGYVSEAVKALLDYVFTKKPQAIITGSALGYNIGSVKVFLNNGFKETMVDHNCEHRGSIETLISYEIKK